MLSEEEFADMVGLLHRRWQTPSDTNLASETKPDDIKVELLPPRESLSKPPIRRVSSTPPRLSRSSSTASRRSIPPVDDPPCPLPSISRPLPSLPAQENPVRYLNTCGVENYYVCQMHLTSIKLIPSVRYSCKENDCIQYEDVEKTNWLKKLAKADSHH